MIILARKFSKAFYVASAITAFIVPTVASAAILSNDSGGDGYVVSISNGFDLFGSDNSSGSNNTFYTTIASAAATYTFNYTYTTKDCCGSFYDPAGYVIGSTLTQLSPDSSPAPYSFSDVVTFSVAAGETYGFYVATTDGRLGRADIAVTPGLDVSSVPLPASAPMFGAALLALAGFRYSMTRWVAPKGRRADLAA